MAFGGSQVTRERESGALVSLGDDLKPRRRTGRRSARRSSAWGCGEYDGVIDFDKAMGGPSTRRGCCQPMAVATTCTPTMPAASRWPMPST
jgi:hypothetical protein